MVCLCICILDRVPPGRYVLLLRKSNWLHVPTILMVCMKCPYPHLPFLVASGSVRIHTTHAYITHHRHTPTMHTTHTTHTTYAHNAQYATHTLHFKFGHICSHFFPTQEVAYTGVTQSGPLDSNYRDSLCDLRQVPRLLWALSVHFCDRMSTAR